MISLLRCSFNFSVQGIEVLGTPLDTDVYIKDFVSQNCTKIARNVEKLESITDGFVHFQLVQKCMNTCTQYMSANITLPPQEQFLSAEYRHVDTVITNPILKKGTRGSFHLWVKDDYDLAVTVFQKPDGFGGFGLTPNVIAQSSAEVTMTTRFLSWVGSFTLEEQKLWLRNQLVHDPESWTAPHLFQLKREYEVLVKDHGCQVQKMYTVQDHPPPPSEFLQESITADGWSLQG